MLYEFKFPDVGEGVHEGKILQLMCLPGDEVKAGQILAVVETDKVVAEIPSPKNGLLVAYKAVAGQVIAVGSVLATIQIEDLNINDDAKKEFTALENLAESANDESVGVVGQLELAGNYVLPSSGEGFSDLDHENSSLDRLKKKILASPLARKMAMDHQISLDSIQGTGPSGRIMKEDVIQALQNSTIGVPETKPRQPVFKTGNIVDSMVSQGAPVEMTTLRKTIIRNMEKSQQIPSFVIHDQTVVNKLVQLRQRFNSGAKDIKISYIPIFMKAIAQTIALYPLINSLYDAGKQTVTISDAVNIGFAVDTADGLVVPVIKNVQIKSIKQLQDEMSSLVDKAKSKKLSLSDLQGGSITLSNYGAFGGIYGTPMILAPQVAIIGFGRMLDMPIVNDQKQIEVGTVLPLSGVFDHRVVDGAPAGKFLTQLLAKLSDPEQMLFSMT